MTCWQSLPMKGVVYVTISGYSFAKSAVAYTCDGHATTKLLSGNEAWTAYVSMGYSICKLLQSTSVKNLIMVAYVWEIYYRTLP